MKNNFIKKYAEDNHLTILQYDEERHWGGYYIFEECHEYDRKILWLKPHACLSLQYHGTPDRPGHHEEGEGLTDMILALGKEDMTHQDTTTVYEKVPSDVQLLKLQKGEKFFTPSGVLHAYINPFDYDIYLLETRISHIPEKSHEREANITRIYDTSMR